MRFRGLWAIGNGVGRDFDKRLSATVTDSRGTTNNRLIMSPQEIMNPALFLYHYSPVWQGFDIWT